MRIEVVTLFPQLIRDAIDYGVLARAVERRLVDVGTVDPRQFADDPHRTVDDRPYGGGPGMVGTPQPWAAAIEAAHVRAVQLGPPSTAPAAVPKVYLSAQGRRFEQADALRLASLPACVLVAGRYEGLDERIIEELIDEELSLGDFVLSGGEFAALAVIDAVARLQPGALGDERSSEQESFAVGRLDWPHYTRPVQWRAREVPQVLQGGHHAQIAQWRLKEALGRTWMRRPDLVVKHGLSAEESRLLNEYLAEREVKEHGKSDR